MNVDNSGLFYYDENSCGKEISFIKDNRKVNQYAVSRFYELLGNNEQIIKCPKFNFDSDKVRNMLEHFIVLAKKVKLTDLPTSYYMEKDKLKGTVIPYYKDAPSLYNIMDTNRLSTLMNYYKKDDDKIHNLFILFNDVLDIIEELKDNDIMYYDINPGNFVIQNNKIQLIDFDPELERIEYSINRKNFLILMQRVEYFVYFVIKGFNMDDMPVYRPRSFKSMRKRLIKEENKLRKR